MIETTCPRCGTVLCETRIFELWLCADAPVSFYTFTCPKCGDQVHKPANDRAIETLIAERARAVVWQFPAEMTEAHDGPPLTLDDLIDLHIELETEDWPERIAGLR